MRFYRWRRWRKNWVKTSWCVTSWIATTWYCSTRSYCCWTTRRLGNCTATRPFSSLLYSLTIASTRISSSPSYPFSTTNSRSTYDNVELLNDRETRAWYALYTFRAIVMWSQPLWPNTIAISKIISANRKLRECSPAWLIWCRQNLLVCLMHKIVLISGWYHVCGEWRCTQ